MTKAGRSELPSLLRAPKPVWWVVRSAHLKLRPDMIARGDEACGELNVTQKKPERFDRPSPNLARLKPETFKQVRRRTGFGHLTLV